jgi:hypothetical protein
VSADLFFWQSGVDVDFAVAIGSPSTLASFTLRRVGRPPPDPRREAAVVLRRGQLLGGLLVGGRRRDDGDEDKKDMAAAEAAQSAEGATTCKAALQAYDHDDSEGLDSRPRQPPWYALARACGGTVDAKHPILNTDIENAKVAVRQLANVCEETDEPACCLYASHLREKYLSKERVALLQEELARDKRSSIFLALAPLIARVQLCRDERYVALAPKCKRAQKDLWWYKAGKYAGKGLFALAVLYASRHAGSSFYHGVKKEAALNAFKTSHVSDVAARNLAVKDYYRHEEKAGASGLKFLAGAAAAAGMAGAAARVGREVRVRELLQRLLRYVDQDVEVAKRDAHARLTAEFQAFLVQNNKYKDVTDREGVTWRNYENTEANWESFTASPSGDQLLTSYRQLEDESNESNKVDENALACARAAFNDCESLTDQQLAEHQDVVRQESIPRPRCVSVSVSADGRPRYADGANLLRHWSNQYQRQREQGGNPVVQLKELTSNTALPFPECGGG